MRVLDGVSADLLCRGRLTARSAAQRRQVRRPASAGCSRSGARLAELLRARELYIAFGGSAAPRLEPDGRLSVYLYDRSGAEPGTSRLVLLGWGSYVARADTGPLDESFRARAGRGAHGAARALDPAELLGVRCAQPWF